MSTSIPRISVRIAKDHDNKRWDDFVLRQKAASPYHLYAWKNAIEFAYGHKCIYFLAENNSEILGVLPLVHLRLSGVINQLVGLPYCDTGNCIAIDNQVQDLLLSKAMQYSDSVKAKQIQLRGDLLPSALAENEFQTIQTGKVRLVLEFPSSSDELFTSFKSKLRSQIKKAKNNGVSFLWGDMERIQDAYSVFSKNMHELGSPVHAKSFIEKVLVFFGERARLGLVQFNNQIIGMGIILLGANGVCIPWASTDRDYNRLGPNMLLYWRLLKFSVDNGYSFFDFGRSTEGEGTYKFKRQWGASPVPLNWYEHNYTNKVNAKSAQNDSSARNRAATVWKNIPYGLANRLGPYLRKYISL